MNENDCMVKVTLSDGRDVLFFPVKDGKSAMSGHSSMLGSTKHYDMPVPALERIARDMWRAVGVSITRAVHTPINNTAPTWHTDWGVTVTLNSRVWYPGDDERYEEYNVVWYLTLDKALEDVEGALDDDGHVTEGFREFLVDGLWGDGFVARSPSYPFSPSGQMFVSFTLRAQGKRVLVRNQWLRDV